MEHAMLAMVEGVVAMHVLATNAAVSGGSSHAMATSDHVQSVRMMQAHRSPSHLSRLQWISPVTLVRLLLRHARSI